MQRTEPIHVVTAWFESRFCTYNLCDSGQYFISLILNFPLPEKKPRPSRIGSVERTSACRPKGPGLNPSLGHVHLLQAPWALALIGGNQSVCRCVSLTSCSSVFPSLRPVTHSSKWQPWSLTEQPLDSCAMVSFLILNFAGGKGRLAL